MLAAAALSTSVSARGPECRWDGDPIDPFTGQDTRHLTAQMRLVDGRPDVARMHIHRAADGVVRFEILFDELGESERMVDATISYLLDDGTVITLSVTEAKPPTKHSALSPLTPYQPSPFTRHIATGQLSVDDASALAHAQRVTRLRHNLLFNGTITRQLKKRQSDGLRRAMACVIGE